jgi:hypothetical protein
MPFTPVVQLVIETGLTNVPVEATPFTQLLNARDADMFVARHLI